MNNTQQYSYGNPNAYGTGPDPQPKPYAPPRHTWLVVIIGAIALIVLAANKIFYKPIVIFLVGVLAYRLLN